MAGRGDQDLFDSMRLARTREARDLSPLAARDVIAKIQNRRIGAWGKARKCLFGQRIVIGFKRDEGGAACKCCIVGQCRHALACDLQRGRQIVKRVIGEDQIAA